MESPKITYKYYSNPAFCAQSEVVYTQQAPCVSPRIATSPNSKSASTKRMPPLGANSPKKLVMHKERKIYANQRVKTDISDNPLRNIYSKDTPPPKPGPKPSKPIMRQVSTLRRNERQNVQKTEEHVEMYGVGDKNYEEATDSNTEEETTISSRVLKHRYAEIPDDYDEYSPSKKRIIETEPEEYNVDAATSEEECKEVPTEIVRAVNGKIHRYAIIPSDDEEGIVIDFDFAPPVPSSPPTFHITSPEMSRKHIEATQKLHEYLSTPKKTSKRYAVGSPIKSCSSSPSLRAQYNAQNARMSNSNNYADISTTPSKSIVSSTPKRMMTPSKSCVNIASPPLPRRNSNITSQRRNSNITSPISPRVQQKLNYGIPINNSSPKKVYAREKSFDNYNRESNRSYDLNNSKDFENGIDKQQLFMARSTAVISPRMVSKGSSSIYSDGFSRKSWKPTPGCATLMLVAAMLALCGGLSASLSFYMMYSNGRKYYLDIGVLSGFTTLILGLLGFRSRTSNFLPNRNYISGYLVISVFSLISCGALIALMVLGLDWGNGALQGIVGGIVTGLGVLCLLLAVTGTVSSYCCGHPPPDNRVADASEPL